MGRPSPDGAALEIAHRRLDAKASIEDMLGHPALRIILENRARYHMQQRARLDVKKLQANDMDKAMDDVIEDSVLVVPGTATVLLEVPARRLVIEEVSRCEPSDSACEVVTPNPSRAG